jgi:transposase
MTWKPTTYTRHQLEERRLEAARLLKQRRLSKSLIAKRLGVSRAAVSQWAKPFEIRRPASSPQPQVQWLPSPTSKATVAAIVETRCAGGWFPNRSVDIAAHSTSDQTRV